MQTHFSAEALNTQAGLADLNQILRQCVHCGFCTATCPTYVVTGNEADSPRGRIYLARHIFETGEVTKAAAAHIDHCLGCLSCMTTCPAKVDYGHLIEATRQRIHQSQVRSLKDKWQRRLLIGLFTKPWLVGVGMKLGRMTLPLSQKLRPWLPPLIKAMLELLPSQSSPGGVGKKFANMRIVNTDYISPPKPSSHAPLIAIWKGCVQRHVNPSINLATQNLLRRLGYQVVELDFPCCGALPAHQGEPEHARHLAKQMITAVMKQHRLTPLSGIVATASGCGSTVKDYSHLLPASEDAEFVAKLCRDSSEFVEEAIKAGRQLPITPEAKQRQFSIVWHGACSLQHGQSIRQAPLDLLAMAGYQVSLPQDSHLCCGAAGIYHLLEPELSHDLKTRKLAALQASGANAVAMSNLGCMMQLQDLPNGHLMEFLEWACGGAIPSGLDW